MQPLLTLAMLARSGFDTHSRYCHGQDMKKLIVIWTAAAGLGSSWAGQPVKDFKLFDVNPNSARNEARISPRDYLLQVSGYYFGDAG